MSDDAVNYTTRKVATRTPETQTMIDAAHAMPGGPRQDREGAPVQTPEARDAKIEGPMKPAPRGGKP